MADQKDPSTTTVLKESFMVKRSQRKSRFSPVNFKSRWFVLTGTHLQYYDGGKEKKGQEKGRIPLKYVKMIENLAESALERKYAFQIGYEEYVLYIIASSTQERDEWVAALRELCCTNNELAEKYHKGVFVNNQWNCCKNGYKSHSGCDGTWVMHTKRKMKASSPATTPIAEIPDGPSGGSFESPLAVSQLNQTAGKIVVAMFDFHAIEEGDLSLRKGEEYEVIDDSREHWWEVRDKSGAVGFIPSNYIQEKTSLGLHEFEWFFEASRQRCEMILRSESKEGCFIVRNSSTQGMYTLSLYTRFPQPQVKHYHIRRNAKDEYYLAEKHAFTDIKELVTYHQHNSAGLITRLRSPPSRGRPVPPTAGLSHDKWEIDPSELTLLEELGSGQFGVVRKGKWRGSIDVAVKIMKEGTMSEDDFIAEAQVMTKLQDPNLVQLYGVCSNHRPIFIVTEYMRHGSLLNYIRRHENRLSQKPGMLLDMAVQVCNGMAHLEQYNYIHRDLAARNCLVGTDNVIKVADFGLARYVLDDEYTSSSGTKFPIKWAPPEVLYYTKFSSKSDVWAYGVLMWEIFTCGKVPYGKATNVEVVEKVQKGQRLYKPASCPNDVYSVMKTCWEQLPDNRPSFKHLQVHLEQLGEDRDM